MTKTTHRAQRLVLLGTGVADEPLGAWFEAVQAADLGLAAAQGGAHLVEVEAGWLQALDPLVAMGQLLGPGRPSTLPPMRRATYDALRALPGMVAHAPAPAGGAPAPGSARAARQVLQTSKRTLRIGSIVLASTDVTDGWFEAEIVAMRPGGELQLRWRDYPGFDPFTKPLAAVAVPPAGGLR